jgi:hypothetical protein
MSTVNPYASPRLLDDSEFAEILPSDASGLWRDGKYLVIRQGATFPNRCVKTNRPATRVLKRDFAKRWLVWFPISEAALLRRKVLVVLASVMGASAFPLLFLLARTIDLPSDFPVPLIAFAPIAVIVLAIVIGANAAYVVRLRIGSDNFLWISGVHRRFLAALPEWPRPGMFRRAAPPRPSGR